MTCASSVLTMMLGYDRTMQISNTASASTRSYTSTRDDAEARADGPAGVDGLAGVDDLSCAEQRVAEAAVASAFPVADVVELPADRALFDPNGPCLSWPGGSFDNSEFASAVAATAHAMRTKFRVGHGSVVGVLLRNVPEVITTMFATWSLGAALTPINPALTDDEVSFQLDDSGAVVLIGDSRAGMIADVRGLGFLPVDEDCFRGGAEPIRDLDIRGDDASLIIYTSGTTGGPKGCVLDQSNISSMVWSILSGIDFGQDARSLLVLPLFHCNGLLAGTVAPLMFGGSVHVLPKFDPITFWDAVEDERPTYFSAVPTIYSVLEATTQRSVDTSSLRYVICGAAPMSVDAITRFESKFDVTILEGYGLSECSVAATLNRNDGTHRPGTVGTALPGITVAAKDPEGRFMDVGEAGEVVISGQTVMKSYLGRSGATAETLRDGWLHTGDIGYLDEDGYLTLVDRIKDMIIRGGENIYPKEIEDALLGHPQVTEAAIVGSPDDKYGEIPIAHVALRTDAKTTSEELQEFLETKLAQFKVPAAIHIVASMPKNSVGKIHKGDLREK